jgi:hypothetical protein
MMKKTLILSALLFGALALEKQATKPNFITKKKIDEVKKFADDFAYTKQLKMLDWSSNSNKTLGQIQEEVKNATKTRLDAKKDRIQ